MTESEAVQKLTESCDFFARQDAVAGRAELPEFFSLVSIVIPTLFNKVKTLETEVSTLKKELKRVEDLTKLQ
ncbi:MAG: hypothetical protein ACKVP0_14320 [Pirellulaceae bacterium]